MEKTVVCSMMDTEGCIARRQVELFNIPKLLSFFERAAAELMQGTDADHVLYACKIYGADGSLTAVQFFCEVMDDETFYRITGKGRGALIYALHNRRRSGNV